jgi:hypothetical protein
MPRTVTAGAAFVSSIVLTLVLAQGLATSALAQTTLDPRVVEFRPSLQHSVLLPDGQPAVSRYDMSIYVAGSSQAVQVLSLGKPNPEGDGLSRVSLVGRYSGSIVPGITYVSTVTVIGPQGSSASTLSNQFAFSPCVYSLSAAQQSFTAAGGAGSVGVSVTNIATCAWSVTSSAGWVSAGVNGGSGSGTVAFTVAPNITTTPRSAVLTIAGQSFTVSQAGAAQQTLTVSTEADLQAAVATLGSNTTILIAPGIYQLSSTLRVNGALSNVTLRGNTGNRDEVVLVGRGMTNASYGTVPTGIWTSGGVQGIRIADLTVRDVYRSAVLFDAGTQAPVLSNVRLVNAGEALVRVNAGTSGGVNGGVIERSLLEYTTTGASAAAGGVYLLGAANWIVRDNTLRNIAAPAGQTAWPAIVARSGSSNSRVERNLFINCQGGVSFGVADVTGVDHQGGLVVNNMFYRGALVAGGPAIVIADSPNSQVLFNTVVTSGTYASPIEYRYPGSTNVLIANNLLDGTVWARDGALGTETTNGTFTGTAMFVNAPAGDLHLRSTAVTAIDRGTPLAQAPTDVDGELRSLGAAPDVGADETIPATNIAPTVTLTSPVNGSVIQGPTTLQLSANAADPDGVVASVRFYAGGKLISTDTSAPYAAAWRVTQAGTYTVAAVATDTAGASATSQVVVSVRKGK